MNLPQFRRFVADSTLGRLARWLRLMGFDTAFDAKPPDPHRLIIRGADGRLVLTRSPAVYQHMADCPALLVDSEVPRKQVRQIICELHIGREEARPFTRCVACNGALRLFSKVDAAGFVPDYVLQHQARFHQCLRCHRIYWPGSHYRRGLEMMDQWFEEGEI